MDATDVKAARRRWGLALLLMAALFFVPLPSGLQGHRVLGRLSDLVHLPLMATVTLLLQARGPLRGRLGAAAAATAVLSLLIETGQEFTGRNASLVDLGLDAAGIVGALAWLGWRAGRVGAPILLVAAGLWLVAAGWHLAAAPGWLAAEAWAKRSFPLLSGFETRTELANWRALHGSTLSTVPAAPAEGLALRLEVAETDRYPGADLRGFPKDWRGRTRLTWRARAPEAARPLRYGLRLDDLPGRNRDWAAMPFQAGPDWQEQGIELAALETVSGRPLDLGRIGSLVFYLSGDSSGAVLELDDLRLR